LITVSIIFSIYLIYKGVIGVKNHLRTEKK